MIVHYSPWNRHDTIIYIYHCWFHRKWSHADHRWGINRTPAQINNFPACIMTKSSLSTQRLASVLICLCLICFLGYNLLPYANFLKLTKTYQFMRVYNSDIHKRYIWEFRPVKVILNIVWNWKWATYINLFIWRKNHRAWFGSKCQPP